jgi:hypothetical protein
MQVERLLAILNELFPNLNSAELNQAEEHTIALGNAEELLVEPRLDESVALTYSLHDLLSDPIVLNDRVQANELLLFRENVLFLRANHDALLGLLPRPPAHLKELGLMTPHAHFTTLLGCLGTFKSDRKRYTEMCALLRAIDWLEKREPGVSQLISQNWAEVHSGQVPRFLAPAMIKDKRLLPLIELVAFARIKESIFIDVHQAAQAQNTIFQEHPSVNLEPPVEVALAQGDWLALATQLWRKVQDEKDARFRIGLAALHRLRIQGGRVDGALLFSLLEPSVQHCWQRLAHIAGHLLEFLEDPSMTRMSHEVDQRAYQLTKSFELAHDASTWLREVLVENKYQPLRKRLASAATHAKRTKQ